MNTVAPGEVADDALVRRMTQLGVREADLEETFVRSGGHGGQHVNKTSTCVMLHHRPTGLRVKCQDSRSQGANRQAARRMLLAKIEAQHQREAAEARDRKEKLRRKNRPRSRAAKERILTAKKRRSEKKTTRKVGRADY
jgi:protein subunit release factor B